MNNTNIFPIRPAPADEGGWKNWQHGIQEDVLDGQGVAVFAIELSAALGWADMQPVGSKINRCPEYKIVPLRFPEERERSCSDLASP